MEVEELEQKNYNDCNVVVDTKELWKLYQKMYNPQP